jgi:Ran GTPase-activating protein (RanGAP) involved in mRNA processing and transport
MLTAFSIKDRKLKLDQAEDCGEILAQIKSSQYGRVELNGNTISAPAAKAIASSFTTQSSLQVSPFCPT